MAGKDYYSIMGVSRGATEKEIKQAFRKLARKYHPDINPGDKSAEQKFKEINEAHEVLSDPEKRKKYDQYGDQWQYADQFAAGAQRPGSRGGSGFSGYDFRGAGQGGSSYFGGEGMEDILGSIFGRSSRRPQSRRGQDIESHIEITLEEAFKGTSRVFNLQTEEPGPTGPVPRNKQIEASIPAGVKTGSRVRIAGQGGAGRGGAPGDLFLVITVKPHPQFERHGDNIQTTVQVPITKAALGGTVQVPTVKGTRLELKIPPETQNNRIFKLTGQGMPQPGKSGHGDLLVKVNLQLPTDLSTEEKELFEKLRSLRPE